MPTVPVIQTQVANVGGIGGYSAPQAAPVIDQRPQMIQQAGQAMSQSAEQWAQLEAQRRRRADIAANSERAAALGEQDIEADAAYGRLEGKAAYEGFQGYVESRDKRYKAALEAAPEGPQREWLRQHLAQERQRFYNSAVVHREKQTFVWRKASATAEATTAQQKAVSMWASPDADSLVAEARDKWGEIADMDGLDDKAKQQFVSANMSNLHAQTLDVMLNEQRLGQATKYFAENGAEIDPVAKSRIGAKLKAQAIEEGARMLDATVGSYDERLTRVQEMVQDGQLTPEDGESARRHLRQFDQQRNADEALVANGVENELRQWMAEHPFNDPSDNPELFAKATRYNVRMERNPDTIVEFERQLESMPAESDRTEVLSLDKLQQMTDGQLLRFLGRGLSDFDRRRWFAFVRGDQDVVGRQDRIKRAAEVMGLVTEPGQIIDKSARAANAAALNTFEQHVDKQIKRLRIDKKRDLSNDEIQKEVLDPMIADKVTVDTWGPGVEVMPVYRAQVDGYLPVDDPNTPDDESLSVSSQDVYVDIDGKLEPLYQIPAQERRRLQLDWDKREQKRGSNRQMTAEDLMKGWIEAGRPGGPKRPEQPAPSPSPTSGMADPLRFGGR